MVQLATISGTLTQTIAIICLTSAATSALPQVKESTDRISIGDVCGAGPSLDPSVTNFQWSPNGKYVAYLRSSASKRDSQLQFVELDILTGKSQVVVEDPEIKKWFPFDRVPGVENRQLVERSKLAGFRWSPDSASVLFFSGTSLVLYDREAGKSHTLFAGAQPISDPQFSPDGRWVSMIRDHNIWLMDAKGGRPTAITYGGNSDLLKGEPDWLYRHELGLPTGYWWSPDSKAVAYLEFNESKVSKYSPPFQSDEDGDISVIHYPKPGEANPRVDIFVTYLSRPSAPLLVQSGSNADSYLPRVKWLPDGSQLAFERMDRPQQRLDLYFANPKNGTSKIVVTDKDQYWINLSDDLYFLGNSKRFIWSSERTGYRHLYLYNLDGTLISQLTHGDWEVTSLKTVDEVTGTFYYISTQKSPLERQLYSSGLEGGVARQLTQEKGNHEVEFERKTRFYIDTYSTVNRPPQRSLYSVDGTSRYSVWKPEKTQEWASTLSQAEFFKMKAHDGMELNGFLIKPPGFRDDHRYPVVVYVKGGPGTQAVRDAWEADRSFFWNRLLAQNGFVVFAVDNRGTAGRGHLFEEYIHLRFGGQEMSDQHDGLDYLRTLPYIDSKRIGIWGHGFGASLTVQGFLNPPLRYKAGFALAPVVDWNLFDSAFAERYLGNPGSNQDGYGASSPFENTKRFKGPLLIVNGTLDEQVHPDQSMELERELLEVGKSTEVVLLPGQDHNISDPNACSAVFRRAMEFFLGNL